MSEDDGYTIADVTAAEARIRSECPTALINRGNYGFTLAVAKADKSVAFFVYDAGRNRPTVIGDLDKIIALLKQPSCALPAPDRR